MQKENSWRVMYLSFIASILLLSSCLSKEQEKAVLYNVQLGMTYLQKGDKLRAKRKLLHALHLQPSSSEANGAMAYFYEKIKENEKAQYYYRKALSRASYKAETLNNYAVFLCKNGKYAEAIAYFLRAMQDESYIRTADLYENAGFCAYKNKDTEKAVAFFLQALQQDEQKEEVVYALIKIEMHRHHPQKVLEYLQKYSKLVNQHPDVCLIGMKAAQELGQKEISYPKNCAKAGV